MKYKIVDLFAGPGGLGEGFASYKGDASFEIAVSAEMEESAHKTLTLRSFFRHIRGDQKALAAYYDFCHSADAPHPGTKVASAWKDAQAEANKLTLGVPADNDRLDELIGKAGLREEETVLIGGPPCQAYSLVGRSRNRGKEDYVAENDHRHFLYREYLRILNTTRPAVFVMENVKGILSSKVNGKLVFHDILRDLAEPGEALGKPDDLKYTIHSLVKPVKYEANMDPASLDANAFIIESEKYGIPQARHRVILLGVRQDFQYNGGHLLTKKATISVEEAIGALPKLRSRLSKDDSDEKWRDATRRIAERLMQDARHKDLEGIANGLRAGSFHLGDYMETGSLRCRDELRKEGQTWFTRWVKDKQLEVRLNHESRSHMESDLARYFYTAVYGELHRQTPKGHLNFPLKGLAPDHKNWESGKFIDRFRVQLREYPSSTVTSHIAKDGHYFIHYDPAQCRSLTVREAARLQTFPDNYFFQGNRTQQYHQVGNAVPSLLANQIAHVVAKILRSPRIVNAEVKHSIPTF